MEEHLYHSAFYGDFRIRASRKVHNNLKSSTIESLGALVHGAEPRSELSGSSGGTQGDGAESYVDSFDDSQTASVKDVDVPPKCVTVLNTGSTTGSSHNWD